MRRIDGPVQTVLGIGMIMQDFVREFGRISKAKTDPLLD
jgi:hypothetical protein